MLAKSEIDCGLIPEIGQNNVWFRSKGSDTVLVFVHGLFSCSRTSWLYNNKGILEQSCYWPQLVAGDTRFGEVDIFLGGYYTNLDSGNYGVRYCVDELFSGIKQKNGAQTAPIKKNKIIFVCHSMGGVIVRSLLERYSVWFKDKDVALILIASPSYGSHVVDTLSPLVELYDNQQILTMAWNSAIIADLDDRFKDLRESGIIKKLKGIEFYESKFIIKSRWFPIFNRTLVVSRESAGRYFGAPKQIPGSDHFSICKPRKKADLVHQYLNDFLNEEGFITT